MVRSGKKWSRMFRTSSHHTIDPKGRLIIPARFRELLKAGGGDGVMVTGMDKCLYAYTHEGWGKIENKILSLAEKSTEMRRFMRFFIGRACECNCDKQGRILIPPDLRRYAKLEKEIVLAGVVDHFEIWSRDKWEEEETLMEEDIVKEDVRIEIAKLGL